MIPLRSTRHKFMSAYSHEAPPYPPPNLPSGHRLHRTSDNTLQTPQRRRAIVSLDGIPSHRFCLRPHHAEGHRLIPLGPERYLPSVLYMAVVPPSLRYGQKAQQSYRTIHTSSAGGKTHTPCIYWTPFLPKYVTPRVVNPIQLKTANIRVRVLPQLATSSFIRRPIVPVINRTKAVNLMARSI